MIDPQLTCAELVELVTDWMEDDLDGDTRQQFEEHLVVCPPCGAYVTQMRQATTLLSDLDAVPDAPAAATRDELLRVFRSQRAG